VDINATASGNHTSAFTFSGIAAQTLSNQRLCLGIVKSAGADATMVYNTNDFDTKLVTP
jgi:hypothetical protein